MMRFVWLLLGLCSSLWAAPMVISEPLRTPFAPKEVVMARHITHLEAENQWLMHQMQEMQGQLHAVIEAYRDDNALSWWQIWPLNLVQAHLRDADDIHLFLAFFGLVVFGLWVWMQNTSNQEKTVHNQATEDACEEDEYNYLASSDALPAKLDLARAYIAMEDHSSALKVLSEVMQLGDRVQRQEAQVMLDALQPS